MKNKSTVFWVLAVLLSDVMCAVVAYDYCEMRFGIRYLAFSAPAWVAFLKGIPFAVGIVICVILAVYFKKKKG